MTAMSDYEHDDLKASERAAKLADSMQPLRDQQTAEVLPGAIPNETDEAHRYAVANPPQPNIDLIIAPDPGGTHFHFYRRRPFRWWQVWLFKWAMGIVIEQTECKNQWKLKKAFTDWAAH